MSRLLLSLVCGLVLANVGSSAELPPPVNRPVSFSKEIAPMFQKSCVQCHGKGKDKGGFSLETREAFLKGGDSGPAAESGKSSESYLVELVAGLEPDSVMPKKGSRWTAEQVGMLRAWIDQGMPWEDGFSFAKPQPRNLTALANAPLSPEGMGALNELLDRYANATSWTIPGPIDDARFARRAYLDLIGLLPTPEQLAAFMADTAPDKRRKLTKALLSDSRAYAEHWLTFWNDLLRNDYQGTGFIDGGRRQVSGWLYNALVQNMPYDQFVRALVNPTTETEGFVGGILWRGTVNASMTPPMQAAQNVSQVFMGVNLKCAACHDSFINDWSLADAYGMAAIYSDEPLELVHCDKPTGKQATLRFLYPELGTLNPGVSKAARLQQFAGMMTDHKNGRLARTMVNRLWARLLGRGLVEPVDDMEQAAWSSEILDWLARDLIEHRYDIKRTLEVIVTSRAYQLPSIESADSERFVFRGPTPRRLTAEQFSDAIGSVANVWPTLPSSLEFDLSGGGTFGNFAVPQWIWTDEPLSAGTQRRLAEKSRAQLADAQAKADGASSLVQKGDPAATQALEAAAQAAEQSAKSLRELAAAKDANDRHRVIFRRRINLSAAPKRAYATVLASQAFDVLVNGDLVKPRMNDGARNGRVRLYDFAPRLRAGENVIVISVDSHTEKGMNSTEREHYPQSTKHLNTRSGLAFYLRYEANGAPVELLSGPDWRVRRDPTGNWGGNQLDEIAWNFATLLPEGVAPVDEGPGLVPVRRKDFANRPVELGPSLRAAVSIAALADRARASMRAADSLMLALDRPNREQVATVRLSTPTTLQSLELTNGNTLNQSLASASRNLLPEILSDRDAWVEKLYLHSLSRLPTAAERSLVSEMLGDQPSAENVADTLWAVLMLPEFQIL